LSSLARANAAPVPDPACHAYSLSTARVKGVRLILSSPLSFLKGLPGMGGRGTSFEELAFLSLSRGGTTSLLHRVFRELALKQLLKRGGAALVDWDLVKSV
jgi:hypothetical protein